MAEQRNERITFSATESVFDDLPLFRILASIVRIVNVSDKKVELSHVFKAHDAPVIKLAYSPIFKDMLVTCSAEGEIFFFEVNGTSDLNKYEPLCMINLPEKTKVNDLKWDYESKHIIVAC